MHVAKSHCQCSLSLLAFLLLNKALNHWDASIATKKKVLQFPHLTKIERKIKDLPYYSASILLLEIRM